MSYIEPTFVITVPSGHRVTYYVSPRGNLYSQRFGADTREGLDAAQEYLFWAHEQFHKRDPKCGHCGQILPCDCHIQLPD
jgi:hypothetical protein